MGSGAIGIFDFQDGMLFKDGKTVELTTMEGAPVRMITTADTIPAFNHKWRRCPDCFRKLKAAEIVIVTNQHFWWACFNCEKWVKFVNGKNPKIYDLQDYDECE